MSVALAIARAAQQSPSRPAVVASGVCRSWSETGKRIAALAAGLLRSGLAPGARLAFLAGNSVSHMELTYAAIWSGIVVVPLNTRLSEAELVAIVRDSGASAIATDNGFTDVARTVAAACGLDRIIAMEGPDYDALLAAPPGVPHVPRPHETLGIYYTGGTTGAPKGTELSHQAIHLTAMDQSIAMECDADAVYLHAMPFFHLGGSSVANAITYRQGTHVFSGDLSPAGLLRSIEEFGVNFLSLVPTTYSDLIDHAPAHPALRGVRKVVYGAAPVSEGLLARMLSAFPSARIMQAYGQTEVGGACVILPPEAHVAGSPHLACAGRATASVSIRITDPDGVEVPRGQPGEIRIAGFRVMTRYRGLPEQTAKALEDGWLHTGDVGIMNEQGYIAVVDRLKDMIVSGGENVFCGEVENAISTHPAVAEVAVTGVPDPRWGEAVHAFIVSTGEAGLTAEDIRAHCRPRIASYKCPKAITLVDALPKSAIGKIRKDLLRDRWLRENA